MIWNKVVTGRLFIFFFREKEKYNAVELVVLYTESLEIKGLFILVHFSSTLYYCFQ